MKYHLGLLENDRQGLTEMESEKVDKQQDSKVNAAAVDEKKRTKKRRMPSKASAENQLNG